MLLLGMDDELRCFFDAILIFRARCTNFHFSELQENQAGDCICACGSAPLFSQYLALTFSWRYASLSSTLPGFILLLFLY